jgi:hypothetical protein
MLANRLRGRSARRDYKRIPPDRWSFQRSASKQQYERGIGWPAELVATHHAPDDHHRDDQQHGEDRAAADTVHF